MYKKNIFKKIKKSKLKLNEEKKGCECHKYAGYSNSNGLETLPQKQHSFNRFSKHILTA